MNILKKTIIIILIIMLSNLFMVFLNYSNAATTSNLVIVLDPGHGGTDPGALGNGLEEREINFKIAKAVRDELKARNPNLTVELTHYGFTGKKLELYERADITANLGADIVISLHINSATDTNAKGAEVWVTRDASEDRYNKNCRLLGDLILREISKLGVYNRGTKNSPVGNTQSPNNKEYYDSGIEVDYYGMIRYPRKLGIPGIIVEHCFISNASDAQYINTDERIQQLAKADADAILEAVEKGYIVKKPATISIISGIVPGTNVGSYTRFNSPDKIVAFFDNQNNQLGTDEILKTGMRVVVKQGDDILEQHTIVIYGDPSGDGKITASDYVFIKNHIMTPSTSSIGGVYAEAADVSGDSKITASDYVLIKNHIMNGSEIRI